MKYLEIGTTVTLACSVNKCPRKRKYTVQSGDENTFPEGTVTVRMKCPWHTDGDFDSEQYYDKDGNEIG